MNTDTTYTKPKLTRTQRSNLARLALAHRHMRPSKKFNMNEFAIKRDGGSISEYLDPYEVVTPPCGTSCCLLGDGPSCGIKPRIQEGWEDYALRVFGCENFYCVHDIWGFLFETGWESIPSRGARRIAMVLTLGVPYDWSGVCAEFEDRIRAFRPDWSAIEQMVITGKS